MVEAGFGVEGEHDTGRAAVGTHHALHACGEGDYVVFEAFMNAVGDGAVVVQRSEYMVHGCFDVFQAVDIEKGFLLTCKRCVRQVFGGCRRTDGNGNIRAPCVCNHFVPCCFDFGI